MTRRTPWRPRSTSAARGSFFAAAALESLSRHAEAIESYRVTLQFAGRLNLEDVASAALARLAQLMEEQPTAAAAEFARLADQYANAGDRSVAALCRNRCAIALEQALPVDEKALADFFESVGRQLETEGLLSEAGGAFERAAHHAGMHVFLSPSESYSEWAHATAQRAVRLLVSAGDYWRAALAESSAAFAFRASRGGPRDPRAERSYVRAARLFRRAGRWREASDSWIAAAIEWRHTEPPSRLGRYARMAIATHERARASEPLPSERRRAGEADAPGLLILAARICDSVSGSGPSRWQQRLLWSIEQAIKGRTFADENSWRESSDQQEVDPAIRDLTTKADHMRGHVDRLDDRVTRLLLSGAQHSGTEAEAALLERDEAKLHLAEAELALERLVRTSRQRRPASRGLKSVSPTTAEELGEVLGRDEAYVGYLEPAGGRNLARSVVDAEGLQSIRLSGTLDSDTLSQLERHLDGCDEGDPDHDTSGHAAAQATCVGLLSGLPRGVRTLFVSPHYQLSRLAWAAAAGEAGKTLPTGSSVALVPSAWTLRDIRIRAARVFDGTYLGVSCNDAGSVALVDDEVRHVAAAYFDGADAQVLDSARCSEFLSGIASARLIHLACHADRSGLLLSHDRTWTPPAALGTLRLEADIIVLTGCHAGLLAADLTNEFSGVVRALMSASGARAVVASRQAVPDAAGFVFSDLFFEAMTARGGRLADPPERPLQVGSAVQWAAAKMQTLPEDLVAAAVPSESAAIRPSDPGWWGPWVVVGDPSISLASE